MSATQAITETAQAIFDNDELPAEFGWLAWLAPRHQRLCIGEIYEALSSQVTAEELGNLVDAWIATAEIEHSPELKAQLERNVKSDRFASVDEWLKTKRTA